MRKYYKWVALCLVLCLSMFAACKSVQEDEVWQGGSSGPVQNTDIHQNETPDEALNDEQLTLENNTVENTNRDENMGALENTPSDETTKSEVETTKPDSSTNQESGDPPVKDDNKTDYTIKCMSFNALTVDAPGFTPMTTRTNWLVSIVKKYDPDLLGLQEYYGANSSNGNYDVHGQVKRELSDYQEYHDPNRIANTIYWKKDRFDVIDTGYATNDTGKWNNGITWAKLYDKQDDVTILFTNVHLDPGSTAESKLARAKLAIGLLEFWKKNCGKDMALYASGDYNDGLTAEPINILSKDKFKVSGDLAEMINHPISIDHVFINTEVQTCYEFYTCKDTFAPENVKLTNENQNLWRPSDHYPVIAYCSNKKS